MPLILPSQRVIRPNPLAYPAGAVPGIDPAHPASNNCALSAINLNGSFVNLAGGAGSIQGAVAGTPAQGIRGALGPNMNFPGASDQIQFIGMPTKSQTVMTAASIFVFTSAIGDQNQYLVSTDGAGNGGLTIGVITGSTNFGFYSGGGGNSYATTIPIVTGVPYFYAVSIFANVVAYCVVRRLDTGKTFSDQVGIGGVANTGDGNWCVSGRQGGVGRQALAYIAAGMASYTGLTLAQLQQWAADPWSFWYPRRTIQYTTPATTTTSGGARIRQRWNRSPLAYPAGAVPGIDRSHPAAQNCTFSGIATQGGTFGNILSRVKGTENGTKTTSLYSSLGPVTNYTAGGSENTIFPFLSAASAPITLAGIFKMTATAVSPAYLLNNSAGGTVGIGDVTPDGTFSGFHEVGGTQNVGTGVSYILGVPYFFAMSFSVTLINWVVARLDTGQVFTGHVTNTTGVIDAGDGNITVGSRSGAARQLGGGIAAAMASNAFMSQQQLLAWAADPWSFWYPNKTINLASAAASAGASFLPAWAYRYNLPVLGTGNF